MAEQNRVELIDQEIVAVITPPGEGGLAALRIAGPDSRRLLEKHFRPARGEIKSFPPFQLRYGYFIDRDQNVIDEITTVFMPEGRSYTGLNQVEIFCHGGRKVVQLIQDQIVASGARIAEPGEFTKLAFLSGRIDLAKAEAVAEMITASTEISLTVAREHVLGAYSEHIDMLREKLIDLIAEVEVSIDYPEEELDTAVKAKLLKDIEDTIKSIERLTATYTGGKLIREGFTVAIAGKPNAGKSSLFNALLRHERALVTPTPGTTRDYLAEWIDLGGHKVQIVDTAGLRQKSGKVEKAGQEAAKKIMAKANLIIWVFDATAKGWEKKLEEELVLPKNATKILLGNKIDLLSKARLSALRKSEIDFLPFSCKTEEGMDKLTERIVHYINEKLPDLTSGLVVTSARHKQKLAQALGVLKAAREKIDREESPELTAFDLREGINALDEITGKVYNEDILGRIFSKFCVGK